MLKRISLPGWTGHLLAIIAGAITPLALAPFNIWPLAILSIALLYLGLRELTPRQALLRGWLYGCGVFLAGTSWVYVSIHDYGAASPALAALLTLAFCAGLGLLFGFCAWCWARFFRRKQAVLADALSFAALWVAQEAFRSWFLTGFPWLYAGYSQLEGPLAPLAPLGGVWLISFALALSATLLVNLPRIATHKAALAAALLMLLSPWIISLSISDLRWTQAKGKPLSVATMQGNIEQNLKWDPVQLHTQLALYRQMTLDSPRTDLVVWPETAIPVLLDRAEPYVAEMTQLMQARDSALITGVPVRQPNEHGELRYYNGILSTGQGEGIYLKQKLVPFGEYVPLQELLRGLIAFFDLPMSDFAKGSADQELIKAQGIEIAALICYEVVYPEFSASLAARSELLLTVSNDTWFGKSLGPLQHLQMAQMRALESGRWMIRATNNGVSALINPQGQISVQIPQFKQDVLFGEVQPMQSLTPYLRLQSWPLSVICISLLLWAMIARKRRPELQ